MRTLLPLALLLACTTAPPVLADVFVNEVMGNPGASDWNQDGVADPSADEYVEVLNRGVREVDLSSWTLSDAFGVRHVFAFPTTLQPGGSIVVFGGGSPSSGIAGLAVTASTGALGLNNTGDTIELSDGVAVVDGVTFGTPVAGTSFNRSPDATSGAPFVLHDTLAGANKGSPGLQADQSAFGVPPLTLPFINEWLPRPTSLVNDWNGDGVANDTGDEFVEILNPVEGGAVDLEGWRLRDAATLYHVFAPGTVLAPGTSIVVVAGAPTGIPGLAVDGSPWGNISNSADDLYLDDETGELVSHVRHTSSTADISWNRAPDAAASTPFFALHYDLSPGLLFSSPGRAVDGTPFPTPEPAIAPLAALAALAALAGLQRVRRTARRGGRSHGTGTRDRCAC